ncbi:MULTISPECIES: TnsD family Tn7-like transposition protein [Paenibacillus]|uniref:TnsD family Tn7-like transposition protein n=1 Tax=Paenibacillus TaxID=44249 RepID=UPI001BCBC956|nr:MULTISPECIES: TnsD family Tn7-like transposition protein [Paenibacillus]
MPLRHILVHGFLGLDIISSVSGITKIITSSPFGKSPWVCLNKASSHYNEAVVYLLEITRCSRTGNPVGTFHCECGFVYSRRGPDTTSSDKYRIGRIKAFGEQWINKLKELSNNPSLSLREIARQLGVDPMTVKVQRTKLNSDRPKINSIKKQKILKPKVHLTTKRTNVTRSAKERFDWNARDIEIEGKVREIARSLSTNPKIRITRTEIGRQIRAMTLLQTKLDRLPWTKATLEMNTESITQYQLRRVQLSTAKLIKTRRNVKVWRVAKVAGLRKEAYDQLKPRIIETIAKLVSI